MSNPIVNKSITDGVDMELFSLVVFLAGVGGPGRWYDVWLASRCFLRSALLEMLSRVSVESVETSDTSNSRDLRFRGCMTGVSMSAWLQEEERRLRVFIAGGVFMLSIDIDSCNVSLWLSALLEVAAGVSKMVMSLWRRRSSFISAG